MVDDVVLPCPDRGSGAARPSACSPVRPVSRDGSPGGRLLVRNTVLNILGQIAPLLVAIVTVPAVIRGLGEARFGILSLSWVVLGYFGIFDLGMGRAATKYVAEALGRGESESIPPLVWSAVLVQAVFGVLGGLLLALGTPYLVNHLLTVPPELIGETRRSFHLLAAAVPLVLVASSFRGVLEAAQRFDLINLVRVPASIANYVLALVGIILGHGLPAIMLLLLLARAATALAFAILSFRIFPGLLGGKRLELGALRKLVGFGGWVTVSAVTMPVLTYIEHFLIAGLLSVGALTWYSAPFEMVSRTAVFPASVAITLFPAFSYYQANRKEMIAELSWRPLRYLLVTGTPLMVVLVLFAPEILGYWLDGEFAERSAGVLRILAVAFSLNALAYIPFSAVQGLGRPDLKAKLDLVEVPLFVVLAWILIPRYGVEGAALAKLGVTIFDTVGLFWAALRLGAFSPLPVSWGGVRSAVLVTTGYGAVSLGILGLPGLGGAAVGGWGGLGAKITAAAILGAVYSVVVWRTVLDGKDRGLILELGPRILRGRGGVR